MKYEDYPMFDNREDRIFTVDKNATVDEIYKCVLAEIKRVLPEQDPSLFTEYDFYESEVRRLFHIAKHFG